MNMPGRNLFSKLVYLHHIRMTEMREKRHMQVRIINKTVAAMLCSIVAMTSMSSCTEKITEDTENPEEEIQTSCRTVIEEMHCTSGDIDIYGLLYTPEGKEGPLPLVVLSHSSSLTHAAMAPYAQYLAEKGYAAYCFDFCGACEESRSKGRTTEEMTVFTEMEDLEIVLAKTRALDIIDPGKVFMLGSSQGGLVTALVAEKHAADTKGMILFYPAFNIPDLISRFSSIAGDGGSFGDFGGMGGEGYFGSFGGLGDLGGLGGGFGSMGMSDAFVNSIKDYDVYANIGTYPEDIIILHGTNDFIVDIKYSEQAVEKYPSAVLYPIQGASHGFNNANLNGMASFVGGEKDDVVMPYVFRFLEEHI